MIHYNMELERRVSEISFLLSLPEQSLSCQTDHYDGVHHPDISNPSKQGCAYLRIIRYCPNSYMCINQNFHLSTPNISAISSLYSSRSYPSAISIFPFRTPNLRFFSVTRSPLTGFPPVSQNAVSYQV